MKNDARFTALGLILLLASCSGDDEPMEEPDDPEPGCAIPDPDVNPGPEGVIVHLFQWPWDSIARECTDVLGPAGFGGVQVSPPQEHVVLAERGFPWWQDYQPVSYQLVTRRGDRAAFAAMVEACHAAGVEIYVDAIVNHMAGSASPGPGSAGSPFSHYDYPAVPYGEEDFHHCDRNANDDVQDFTSRAEVQSCELVDLSDLATETDRVRGRLIEYLDDLLSLGVDGFRIDAAKHVPVADLEAIFAGLSRRAIVYQEVIEGGPLEISPTEYLCTGDVTEFRYGDVVGAAFLTGELSGLAYLASPLLLDSQDAVVFIDNHDTQRNGRSPLTYRDGAAYALAEAFMLAWPHGTPQVMSSFDFSEVDQGPPAAADGTTTAVDCASGWVCEHRWRTTANMVGFRNQVGDEPVLDWWSDGADQIAFGRGAAGFAVFNRRGESLTRTFQTSLPAGTYCDVAAGDFAAQTCTGPRYTVDEVGRFTATVDPDGMIAIHAGAELRVPPVSR